MALLIKKIEFDGAEYLPDIVDTPLWDFLNPDKNLNTKKSERQLAGLYKAIADRENYFQDNTPTAFGNPDYSYLSGIACGFLQAMDACESSENGQIVIRNIQNNKKLLVVDRLNRPHGYYESLKDNNETLKALGF